MLSLGAASPVHRGVLLRPVLVATWAAAAACTAESSPGLYELPDDFLFGTATAGFQVDMGCPTLPAEECTDAASDWYAYVTSPDTVADSATFLADQDPAEVGPGHWELYEEDFDLAVNDLGNNAFRMSLEWSRIFPTSTAGADDPAALAALANAGAVSHYHAVFAALKARGLTPFVTLHHYTLPTWIHDGVGCHEDLDTCSPRGWLDAETTVTEIAKYAGYAAREFGAEVDLWATQNEPFAVVLPGYVFQSLERTNPPAVSLRAAEAKQAMFAMIDAHARMYDAVKENDTTDADGDGSAADVGLVYAMAPVRPLDPEDRIDVQAARHVFYLWNLAFLNGACLGQIDDDLDGTGEERSDLVGRMDYLGINYYVRVAVRGTVGPALPELSTLSTFDPFLLTYDEGYHQGIYDMATFVRHRYGLPVYIAEHNGRSLLHDDPAGESEALTHAVSWLSRAIVEGTDVRGYFYWSLLDNYEWNQGMNARFGLYAVDPADPTKARVPRESVAVYRSIAESGAVPQDLRDQYDVDVETLDASAGIAE